MQTERDTTEWSAEQNVKQAQNLKQIGNQHFKMKQFKQALRAYHKAILHLAGIIDKSSSVAMYTQKVASEAITYQANQLKFAIYSNMCQIYINQQKYDRGLQVLAKAKNIKTNSKWYYRRATCLMKLSDFDQARSDIVTLMGFDQGSRKQGERLLNQMAVLEKQQEGKSKAMYQKFFK